MTVVYRASVPVYETECGECHSVIRYQKAEAWHNQGYINCPVCGVPIHVRAVNPVTVLDDEEQKKHDASNAEDDYISREAALKAIYTSTAPALEVRAMPAPEVVEVRHGWWIKFSRGDVCSECQYQTGRYEHGGNYCTNCGAKMDGGQDDV